LRQIARDKSRDLVPFCGRGEGIIDGRDPVALGDTLEAVCERPAITVLPVQHGGTRAPDNVVEIIGETIADFTGTDHRPERGPIVRDRVAVCRWDQRDDARLRIDRTGGKRRDGEVRSADDECVARRNLPCGVARAIFAAVVVDDIELDAVRRRGQS